MKNADSPIHPMTAAKINGHEFIDYNVGGDSRHLGGLTKREYFAAMAMQGLLANTTFNDWLNTNYSEEQVARVAISTADELLNRLEL